MTPIKTKTHPTGPVRGVRDGKLCKAQVGGTLAWIEDGQPMKWVDRPHKFNAAMKARVVGLSKLGKHREITDIRWKQINGKAWYRLPAFPTGVAWT